MNNTYRKVMEQQSLSDQAKQAIYRKLQRKEEVKTQPFVLRAAIVAACILLMIPVTVYAVKTIFGVSVVEIIKGNTKTGKFGTGYEVDYPDLSSRQLSDFPEEIQTMEDYRLVIYDSWQDAEEELGITLVNNTFLFGQSVTKERSYNLKEEGIGQRVHCFGQYNGLDNQFYRATIIAAYRYDNMFITLRSTVTCDHPAISKEREYEMHGHGAWYEDRQVDEIEQEQYLAKNGINATVITVDRNSGKATDYEAAFSANGASYRITIHSYDKGRDAEVKETLISILEGFVF